MESNRFAAEDQAQIDDKKILIVEKYKEYLLLNGERPPSIYVFCRETGIEESVFYGHFNSFDQVADAYWTTVFDQVKATTLKDEVFRRLTTSGKLLSFYRNFFEELKKHRSYMLVDFRQSYFSLTGDKQLTELKGAFKAWVKKLLIRGMDKGEVPQRAGIHNIYDSLFWYQFLFLLNFWRKDDSKGFQKTDAAIEKSVQLAFDLIGKNAIDSAFDFARFIFADR